MALMSLYNLSFCYNGSISDSLTVYMLGVGQTSKFLWDNPNLMSYIHKKFEIWLS